jgi:hypothetical protein
MKVNNVEGIGSSSLLSNMPEGLVTEMNQEEVEPKEEVEIDPVQDLLEALADVEDAPDEITIEQWKSQYGRFYVSSIHGDDIYIWHTLKRNDYKKLAASGAMDDETIFKESIMRKCLLFPQPDAVYIQRLDAGVIPTLFEQIMYQSGFIPKEIALGMIKRV